jgi:pyrroloquinoline quinone (PQQ) biosynthesis protein C
MMTPLRLQIADLPEPPSQSRGRPPFADGLAIAAARSVSCLADLPVVADTLAGKIGMTAYRALLAETYHHVRHAVPILRLARARTQGAEERIRRAVHQQFVEAWGYESLLLRDIAECGGDAHATRLGRPAPATRRLIEFAYDWVEMRNPLGVFGLTYALEATRARFAVPAARAITAALGVGPEGLRYLSARAEADQENLMVLERLMRQISAPSDQAAIAEVANATFGLLADFFEALSS